MPVTTPVSYSPTGDVNIVSGITNPFPANVGPLQEIDQGDICYQTNATVTQGNGGNTSTVAVTIALPVSVLTSTVTGQSTATTSQPYVLQAVAVPKFLGLSLSYRDPNLTSQGTYQDRITLATGRAKLAVGTDAASTAATSIGQLWGPAVSVSGTVASLQNQVVSVANSSATAIGRQSQPKAAGEAYVYLDVVSDLVASGVQTIP